MPGPRTAAVSQAKSLQRFRTQLFDQAPAAPDNGGLIRVLVLDRERETLERLQNALWMWPHKVASAKSVNEAVRMCRHLTPTALIAGIKTSGNHTGNTIAKLRKELPHVPIIALGSRSDGNKPGNVLDQGADAFLAREELHRPTLHNLLKRIQRTPNAANALGFPVVPKMSLPWQESEIIGALICDISGTITDANDCFAKWLMYPDTDELLGKCVWRDLLQSRVDWSVWKKIAGDVTAILHQSTGITAKNGQILWMKVEVFAAPSFPSCLQAVFVDQTELAF